MGLNIRLYNISCPNDFVVSISTGYTGSYVTYNTYSGGTDNITIENVEFDTTYFVKIEDVVTNLYVVKTVKTHDSKYFECYDQVNFYIEINCDNGTARLYDLVLPHGNVSSKINNIPCSYYIRTGTTSNILDSVFVTTGTTNQTNNIIHTFHTIPEKQLIYVFLVHGDGYILPSNDDICDCDVYPKKQGGFNVKTIYCDTVTLPNSDVFCYGASKYEACDCNNTVTLYYVGDLGLYNTLYTDPYLTIGFENPWTSLGGVAYFSPTDSNGYISLVEECVPPNSADFCVGSTCVEACDTCVETTTLYYEGDLTTGTTLYSDNYLLNVYTATDYVSYSGICYGLNKIGQINSIENCGCICDSVSGVTINVVNETEVTYTFNNANGASSYTYILSEVSGSTISSGITLPYPSVNTLSGLSSSVVYQLNIISNCGCDVNLYVTEFDTTSRPIYNILFSNNSTSGGSIDSVSPAFFFFDVGSFPILPTQNVFAYGTYTGYTSVGLTKPSNSSYIELYKNYVLVESITLSVSGIYSFTNIIEISPTDTIQIILTDLAP